MDCGDDGVYYGTPMPDVIQVAGFSGKQDGKKVVVT
jgi:hypothetical protein